MESDEEKIEDLEEAVFKALDHQKRRDILRYTGEKRQRNIHPDKKQGGFPG